jgi:ubiquinone/menaquinone biosynthesis C-methylase UbiE
MTSEPGQAVYTPLVLGVYDWYVLGFSASLVWKCPSQTMLDHYNRHVGRRHLDVGVGTGYFLDRARFPSEPEITLFDLNPNSLAYAARRIERHRPTCVRGDVLEPNSLPGQYYDSIALSFLLHCLPDGGEGKWRAFTHLAGALQPGGVLFGSTIVADAPLRRQHWLMNLYNRKGIFSNAADTFDVLRAQLEERFRKVVLEQVGAVAFFAAREPRC